MSRTLIATDLDQTLIYSRRAIARYGGGTEALAAVETYQDVDSSFMTASAAATLAHLADQAVVVPTTTRTPEQFARVRMPGPPPRWVIAANGGILLSDGVPDAEWTRAVADRASGVGVDDVRAHIEAVCRPGWTKLHRTACDLFCYAVIDRELLPDGFVEDEAAWASERDWRVSLQGRKIYWVPRSLTKSAAVAEVARRAETGHTLAAGDSLLDLDLLESADAAIAARHGELVAGGWALPHVEVTRAEGIAAGEEIVAWFARRLRDT